MKGLQPLKYKFPFNVKEFDDIPGMFDYFWKCNGKESYYFWCNEINPFWAKEVCYLGETLGFAETLKEAEQIIYNHYINEKNKKRSTTTKI